MRSRWTWTCPECGLWNPRRASQETVICRRCHSTFYEALPGFYKRTRRSLERYAKKLAPPQEQEGRDG